MNKEERETITEREEFIKICGILAYSDTHPTDCKYITSFIVGLGKEIEELHNKIDKCLEYLEDKNNVEWIKIDKLLQVLKDSDVDD